MDSLASDATELDPVTAPIEPHVTGEPQDYRVVYTRVHGRLRELRRRGDPLPANLVRLEQQLLIECFSLSQGR